MPALAELFLNLQQRRNIASFDDLFPLHTSSHRPRSSRRKLVWIGFLLLSRERTDMAGMRHKLTHTVFLRSLGLFFEEFLRVVDEKMPSCDMLLTLHMRFNLRATQFSDCFFQSSTRFGRRRVRKLLIPLNSSSLQKHLTNKMRGFAIKL
jgi:hypothetical protein